MDSYKNFTGHRYWCILSKYRVIFPRWLELKHISMDLKNFSLLLPHILSPSLAMRESRSRVHMRNDIIVSIYSNRNEQEGALGKPFHFEFLNSNIQVIRPHFKSSFWLFVDNNCIYIVPERQPLAPPRNTQTEATSFTMSMSTIIVHVQKHGKCSNQRKLHLNDPAPLLINIKLHY